MFKIRPLNGCFLIRYGWMSMVPVMYLVADGRLLGGHGHELLQLVGAQRRLGRQTLLAQLQTIDTQGIARYGSEGGTWR